MGSIYKLSVVVVLVALSPVFSQPKKDDFRDPVKQWTGVIKDAKLKSAAKPGEVITNAEAFEKLWKAWQPKAELPKVDFTTQFVLVFVSSYEPDLLSLYGGPEKWNGSNSNKSPQMIKAGFGWGIGVFDRKGVTQVNGQKLEAPKDK